MTENTPRHTATIIKFPVERRAVKGNAQPVVRRPVDRPAVVTVESGSGWYHDAAIQDASTARNR
jgi:hypothetical protein